MLFPSHLFASLLLSKMLGLHLLDLSEKDFVFVDHVSQLELELLVFLFDLLEFERGNCRPSFSRLQISLVGECLDLSPKGEVLV